MKIKLAGFITEHDPIEGSITFDSSMRKEPVDLSYLARILDYLKNGKTVLAWMGYVKDLKTNQDSVVHSYETDGEWIWPSYLPYYLEKYPNLKLDPEFMEAILTKKFVAPEVSDDRLALLENYLVKKLSAS